MECINKKIQMPKAIHKKSINLSSCAFIFFSLFTFLDIKIWGIIASSASKKYQREA